MTIVEDDADEADEWTTPVGRVNIIYVSLLFPAIRTATIWTMVCNNYLSFIRTTGL